MRWFILLLLLALVGAVAKNGCHIREFYGIGYTQHDPTLRHKEMVTWLEQNAPHCKTSDYMVIWNNLSEWAGASDSPQLRGLVIDGYKNAEQREAK